MSKLPKVLFGPMIGKLGPVVGAIWKGIPHLRSMPAKSTKPLTAAQKSNTSKFKFLNNFLTPFSPYIKVGLENAAQKMTAMNAAYSRNCKRIITGVSPSFEIDYSKLIWSEGILPPLHLPTLTVAQPGWITVSWQVDYGLNVAPNDQLILLIYCPELEITDGFIGGTCRQEKQCIFQINPIMLKKELHIYISLTSLDRKKIANNQYLGVFLID